MPGFISYRHPLFLLVTLGILLTGTLPSCSKNAGRQAGGAGSPSPGTGGLAFRLVWQQPPLFRAAQFSPPFNACVDHAIDTISATVSDATATITTSSWPCAAHEGLIAGVPAGTNFTVLISGQSSGSTAWSGLASAITVTANQITDAGTIVMDYIGGDTIQPTVVSIAPASNPSTTTNVPVTDRIIVSFSEPMAVSTITATNIILTLIDQSPVSGNVGYDAATRTASFAPSAAFAYDTQYVLRVLSGPADIANNRLAGDYTNTFTTESAPLGAPDAPSDATAEPGNGQVTLDWHAANGASSYNVYYGLSSGITLTNGTVLGDARAPFVHIGLTNGQTYYYLVSAVNNTGETQAAAEVSATPVFTASTTSVPSAPSSLIVAPDIGRNVLSWPAVTGATSYNLYWSTTPITPGKNAADNVIRNAASTYTHTGLTSGLTYYYLVTALNPSGESDESMQAAATPQ